MNADPRVAALAEALHNADVGCEVANPDVYRADELAVYILAAMPDWTLVPKSDITATIDRWADALTEIARLRAALTEIAAASDIPDGWDPYDVLYGYNSWPDGQGGEIGVDESNRGDVHSHGMAQGRWTLAKVARAALSPEADHA